MSQQVRFAVNHEEIPRGGQQDHYNNSGRATPSMSSSASSSAATDPRCGSRQKNGAAAGASSSDAKKGPKRLTSSSSIGSKVIRENLMRQFKGRDPLFYYDVVSVLGVGSMGSVAKVRKRDAIVGGSARKNLQRHFERERRLKSCFEIPIVGGLFRFCLKGGDSSSDSIVSAEDSNSFVSKSSNVASSSRSRNSSILNTRGAAFETFGDSNGSEPTGAGSGSGSSYEQLYAMKSIHLSRVTDPAFVEELKNEIQILRSLDHPHIIRAIETFDYRNQLFIVMELCTGGDLYTRDPYTEEEAARITSSILSAISFMHSRGITHRDLKYENILFVDNSPLAEIKLIDFGLSKVFFGSQSNLTDGVGTIYTMSPEVLKGSYTQEADVWSVGVIAYMLLSSQMPFYGRKRSAIVEQILEGKYEFRGRRWKKVSAQAKDFVQSLLVVDPSDRATAEEAYSMSWLNKRYTATVRPASDEELAMAKESLFRYSKYSGLKKVALMVIAHKSTSAEIGILRKIFQQYDTKKDGSLSYEEFKAAYAQAGLTADEFSALFDAIDLDGSGRIRYTEFLAATIEARGVISEERLAEAFDRIDSDDSGYITAANLKAILGDEFPDEEINAIIKEADLTLDGRISYAEFLALWEDRNEVPQDKAPTGNASQDSGSDVTPGGVDIVSRANFIESKQSAERRRSSLVELTGDHMEVLFKEEEVPVSSIPSVPSVIFDSSQVNVSERFGDATDLFEESPHRISAVV